MAFQKGKSGNPNGRPKGTTYKKKVEDYAGSKEKGLEEMQLMLKRLKPLSREALVKLGVILRDDTVSEQTQLRAIVLILDKYKDLLDDFYMTDHVDEVSDDKDVEDDRPMVSFVLRKD